VVFPQNKTIKNYSIEYVNTSTLFLCNTSVFRPSVEIALSIHKHAHKKLLQAFQHFRFHLICDVPGLIKVALVPGSIKVAFGYKDVYFPYRNAWNITLPSDSSPVTRSLSHSYGPMASYPCIIRAIYTSENKPRLI
jgi:hypothetical protein